MQKDEDEREKSLIDTVPEVMTTEQAAHYLQLNVETVKQQLRAGNIPGVKLGRAWRIHKAAIDAVLMGGKSAASKKPALKKVRTKRKT